jgi:hypothetical protein
MKQGILDDKTVGEVLQDPELVRQALATLGPFTKARLWMRQSNRLGAWARARKQGLSDEQAHTIVQMHYPSTIWDALYEADYKRRKSGAPRSSLPLASALTLLYPIGAAIYIASYTPAPPFIAIAGYGIANVGYLLFAVGVVAGHFRIFHLEKRWACLLAAATFFSIATILCNI